MLNQLLSIGRRSRSHSASVSGEFDDIACGLFCCTAICVLGLVMRLATATGSIGSDDDLMYTYYAHGIAQNLYQLELHHYAIRYGLTLPVAGVFWLFGLKEWTTIVVPLLASVASIPIVIAIGWKLFGMRAGLLAGALFASFPLYLRYATILVPEPVAEFYILVGVLCYVYAVDKNIITLSLAAGICLGLAYLTKETAAFVAPAVLLDAIVTQRWRVMAGLALGLASIIAVEHAYYLSQSNDLLFRLHALSSHYRNMGLSPQGASVSSSPPESDGLLFYRLFKAYPRMMLVPNLNFGLHSLFALALVIPGCFLLGFRRVRLLILWASLPWLYVNFGSSSLRSYIPLVAADRYITCVFAPLFLISGAVMSHYISVTKRFTLFWFVTVFAIALVGFSCAYSTRAQGWRTDQVAALRAIAHKAGEKNLSSVRFEGDPLAVFRWRCIMAALAPDFQTPSDPREAQFVVKPDAFGLPYVALAPEVSQGSPSPNFKRIPTSSAAKDFRCSPAAFRSAFSESEGAR